MKGIIFNLAAEVVIAGHGEDAWDAVLAGAQASGSYTSLGSYPDSELMAIVAAAADLLGVDRDAVLREVAGGAIPLLATRYPHFFTPHADATRFVLTLNDIIHPEVRKLYPGAIVPRFSFTEHSPESITMKYESERQLCALAEGFVTGAATHYGQTVVINQPMCTANGDPHCLLRCDFSAAA